MEKITQEQLGKILELHKKWLRDDEDGVRANLRGADLRGADLRGADLRGADLRGADLLGANLHGADLRGADLLGANLHGADLLGANLLGANLYGAYLLGANLHGANLHGADLLGADLLGANLLGANLHGADLLGANLREANLPLACPEEGAFIGFKKARGGCIVKLEILADAKRSSATTRKCRCSKAKVLEITDIETGEKVAQAVSQYDESFVYSVGEIVSVDDFDDDRWNECSTGIHFFITKQEAIEY